MSSIYRFNERSYAKMMFHAAKYPHLAVNGIILSDLNNTFDIVDVIPLFHQCLYLTPMAEIALRQIEVYCESEDLKISGYYVAPEIINDNNIDRAPGNRIAEKLVEQCRDACYVMIDNKFVTIAQQVPAIKVYRCNPAGTTSGESYRWMEAKFQLSDEASVLEAVSCLLQRGITRDITDFDNHLDNPSNDWSNKCLNHDLSKLMVMY